MSERPGMTYAISAVPYDGWAKIGRTAARTAKERLRSCQTYNPRKLVLRAVWDVDAEEFVHRQFAEFRGQGEWFALPLAFLVDMARVAAQPRPGVHLAILWYPERIRAVAGDPEGVLSPEKLARFFMSIEEPPENVVPLFESGFRPPAAHAEAS